MYYKVVGQNESNILEAFMIVLKHQASDSWYLHGRRYSQLNSCHNQQLLAFPSQILINVLKWAGHNA
jgi:hypothetical protein